MDAEHTRFLYQTSRLTKTYRAEQRNHDPAAIATRHHAVQFGPISIPRGGVIALVGESGSGKTTLFNLLAGLDEPDAARRPGGPSIRLDIHGDPVDVVANPGAFPRDRVGFVFQSGFLLRNATAGLNLALPSAQQGRLSERADLSRRLKSLGIAASEIDERAWKFSGGEAQRIAFVRAMAHDPQLVFADEPTSNVDYRNAVAIMRQLRDWAHDPAHPGRTVLWITHDLRLAAAVADAVLVLHDDGDAPLLPAELPGDPDADLELRVAALERWSYNKEAMLADAPPPFAGLADGVRAEADRQRPGPLQRAQVKLGAVLKVGLSEVFSRHAAQKSPAVRAGVNARLSVPGAPASDHGLLWRLLGWLWSFGQRSAVLALMLICILGTAGLAILDLVDAHFERSVNDPRTCHVIIKKSRLHGPLQGYGDLDLLSARPWSEHPPGTGAYQTEPASAMLYRRATCSSGDAAYGRIYARGWSIAVGDTDGCPRQPSTSVLLLTADKSEPIWSKVGLLAANEAEGADNLGDYFDNQRALFNDEVYLAAEQANKLGFDDLDTIVGRPLCLYLSGIPGEEPVRLRIQGVLDEVPNWERNRFDGYIPRYTYDAFRLREGMDQGLVSRPTHIALYFASADADALQTFLRNEGYVFVAENLKKILRLVDTAGVFKGIVKGFLALIGLLLVMLTAMSVLNYLNANSESFALLKAFGMNRRFMFGILLVEISVGWLASVLLLACMLLGAELLAGPVWWQIEDLAISANRIWLPFALSAGAVWLLSAGVSLVLTLVWWRQNRYVAQTLKAG